MPVTFRWHGVAEMLEALRTLPTDLKGEAAKLIEARANGTVLELRRAYPARSGTLRDNVTVTLRETGPLGVSARIRNTAPHALLFDEGTQARHTVIGANQGAMPAAHTFVRTMVHERRLLFTVDLAGLITRYGMRAQGRG